MLFDCYVLPIYAHIFYTFTVPNSPANLTQGNISSCAAEVSWDYPEGDFDSFEVWYMPYHGATLNQGIIEREENATGVMYRLIGLLPDTEYNLTVITVTGDVEEVRSEPSVISYTTGEDVEIGSF